MDARLKGFFTKYFRSSSSPVLATIDDENEYESIRSTLLEQPTSIEQQVLSRIASVDDQKKDTAAAAAAVKRNGIAV